MRGSSSGGGGGEDGPGPGTGRNSNSPSAIAPPHQPRRRVSANAMEQQQQASTLLRFFSLREAVMAKRYFDLRKGFEGRSFYSRDLVCFFLPHTIFSFFFACADEC